MHEGSDNVLFHIKYQKPFLLLKSWGLRSLENCSESQNNKFQCQDSEPGLS